MISGLNLKKFFHKITNDRKNTFDCFTISRFLTYARILDPRSEHATQDHFASYYAPLSLIISISSVSSRRWLFLANQDTINCNAKANNDCHYNNSYMYVSDYERELFNMAPILRR